MIYSLLGKLYINQKSPATSSNTVLDDSQIMDKSLILFARRDVRDFECRCITSECVELVIHVSYA